MLGTSRFRAALCVRVVGMLHSGLYLKSTAPSEDSQAAASTGRCSTCMVY